MSDHNDRVRALVDDARTELHELNVTDDAMETLAERFVDEEDSTDRELFVEWVKRIWAGA